VETFLEVVAALAPSVGVGLLFWFAIRKVIHADRAEREAIARMEAEEARQERARAADRPIP